MCWVSAREISALLSLASSPSVIAWPPILATGALGSRAGTPALAPVLAGFVQPNAIRAPVTKIARRVVIIGGACHGTPRASRGMFASSHRELGASAVHQRRHHRQ